MENKKVDILEIIKWILATVIVVAVGILGGICHELGYYNKTVFIVIMSVLSIGLIAATVVSIIMKNRITSNVDRENFQQELLKQRERVGEIAIEKIAMLKRLIKILDLYSIAVLISVCIIVFCFFAVIGASGAGITILLIVGVYTGLNFIRPRKIKIDEKKNDDYLQESEYPLIYKTAQSAADVIGCKGRIKIFVDHEFNAGLLRIADGYSVRLGSYLLDNLSREELYNILLHEFAHVDEKNDEINDLLTYANLLTENNTLVIAVFPYIYLNAKFIFEYIIYKYVCSIMQEDSADLAMRENENPRVAASALIKLKFSEIYEWEKNTYDEERLFESENMIDDYVRRTLRWYKDRLALRGEDWIKMIDSEILSRNATHSTIKMRIDAMGVSDAQILPRCDSKEYLDEVEKAILHLESVIKKSLEKVYTQAREEKYLPTEKILDEWNEAGNPITKENYQGIIMALFTSHRISEFVKLCCRVIEEIPEPANYFAHHMYGIYLLHCYDESGIDHLYKSIELNHNNWEEAMDHIGMYACMVGKQDKLDEYRERAPKMAKEQVDVYEKMNSLNPNDNLVKESLPEELLQGMINYFAEIDGGVIDSIYMIRKIIDDEHAFTCIMVMPKKKVKPEDFADRMEKIFQYLDKSSTWQFWLFDMRTVPRIIYPKVKKNCIYKGK